MQNSTNKEPFTFYKADSYILNHFGVEAACVHAVIRNKSQTPGYVCEFSEQTIGNILHMSYKRVNKAISLLEENGFIEPVKGKTNLKTNAYQCIMEKCDIPLTEENAVSLVSNDNRVKQHKENRTEFVSKKHDISDDTNRINKNDDTNLTIRKGDDGTNLPSKLTTDVTNHPPIKNCSKEIKNKVTPNVSSSFFTEEENNVRIYLEGKLDYRFAEIYKWKDIFRYISEMHENGKTANLLVKYIKETEFDMEYMTLGRLKEIYMNRIQVRKESSPNSNILGWRPEFKSLDDYNAYYKALDEQTEKNRKAYLERERRSKQESSEAESKSKEAV